MKTIKNKVARLVLSISLASILLLGVASGLSIWNIRRNISDSLRGLNNQATLDATDALRTQRKEELQALAENKSRLADTSLNLILNQTRLVAMAAKDIYSDAEQYTLGRSDRSLPLDAFDFSCNHPKESLGAFSFHLRGPRSVMEPDSIVEEDGTVVKAKLDESSLTGPMRRELYLAGFLKGALGGIRNFDNGDGTYNGIGATYFCLQSSGIDVLADTLTTSMVEYDARESAWYTEAAKLKEGGIYWTNPVQDGSGRGVALICAMPVYVDGKLIGVAGSGGLIENIQKMVRNTTIGESGYAFLVNTDGMNVIANANSSQDSEINRFQENLLETGNDGLTAVMEKIGKGESGISQVALDGRESYLAYSPLESTSWAVVTVIGLDDASIMAHINDLQENIDAITQETNRDIDGKILLMAVLFLLIALAITGVIILLSNKFAERLTQPIYVLTQGAGEISSGNLDYCIHLESDDETALLGQAFNHMTDSLKEYIENLSRITAEKERIGTELDIAKNIQASMLPCIFPAFPERREFDIYATMDPAKEVGGDFYDFFMVDERHLAVVVADVSGKGVPAALFMVIGKTLIKDHTKPGQDLGGVFTEVNELLCESNSEGLFITAFEGVLDLVTGELRFVNAGHEIPYISKKGEGFKPHKIRAAFVLAGMEGMQYQSGALQLEPGDKLFQYTDGVTEATNREMELYGTERLGEVLCRNVEASPEELLARIKGEIDDFVGDAPQFDDITMLCLEYKERMEIVGDSSACKSADRDDA